MTIAQPVQDDPGVRLFIGWQNVVDLVFEAFHNDNLTTKSDACRRLDDFRYIETT